MERQKSSSKKLGIVKNAIVGGWRAACIAALFAAAPGAAVSGCERSFSSDDPPLRPLVYTELPPDAQTEPDEPPAAPIVNIAPEDLGYTLFHAVIDGDRTAYESMFIRAEALSELIRMPLKDAQKTSDSYIAKSETLWKLFASGSADGEPVNVLPSRLRLAEFRLGKGRNLAGKIADPETDEVVQHWGNELRIELVQSDKRFAIRVPKIVKTPQGWRIAQPIDVDSGLRMFLEAGMHLKSDLLRSEHYPMPLEVGNFWKYRVEKGDRVSFSDNDSGKINKKTEKSPNSGANADGNARLRAEQGSGSGMTVTDMIVDVKHREGYWIAVFERTSADASSPEAQPDTETFAWLVTPRMIFPCRRDCRNQADNIGYLLGYMMKQTPIFVFPIEAGAAWDAAGTRSARYARYEVRKYHQEAVVVPDGAYIGVYEIFGSVEEGRESRYFMPGTGVVMRIVRSGAGIKREELIQHRLIL